MYIRLTTETLKLNLEINHANTISILFYAKVR